MTTDIDVRESTEEYGAVDRSARGELARFQRRFGDGLERLHESLLRLNESLGIGFDTMPAADIEETDDAFLVEVELPGVKRSDIDVSVSGRRLTVAAERKEKERVGVLRRRTRTVGTIRFEAVLPADVDVDAVAAGLEDGVLTVRLPKLETDKARRIPVS